MPEKTKKQDKSALRPFLLFGVLATVTALIVITTSSVLLYNHTVNLLSDNLRERLLAIVTTAVVEFDPDDVASLREEEDWRTPAWQRVAGKMKRIRENNDDIIFVYMYRKTDADPTQMEFVSDSHSLDPFANADDDPSNDLDLNGDNIIDDADELIWPGYPYPTAPEEAFEAYDGPTTNRELYEDQWGKVLTGYAPVVNDDGEVVGVLAADIKASDFSVITTQTLIPFVIFGTLLVLIIAGLSISITNIGRSRIRLLQELDQQKDELLSIVSHQLATPVSSIKWYLEMLTDGDFGKLNKEQEENIGAMQKITITLADLVQMILDVSRIQLGRIKLDPQPLNLDEFFKEILEVIDPKAAEKGVILEKNVQTELPTVLLDKRYTHMTVENLLSNAVKYTPEQGNVHFTVEKRGERLYCEVKDTGCGIPKAEQEKIFGRMFRASNVRNSVDGNGFGLYVAKGAIESQGGKIWFESEENKGTTFFVDLPLKEASANTKEAGESEKSEEAEEVKPSES